jgi:hypothetical protein
MDAPMSDIVFQLYDSVNDIKESEWNAVFGDLPEGYYFYKALEESKLKEFRFHYAMLLRDNKVLTIAPLFISKLNLDMTITGIAKSVVCAVRKIVPNFFITKTLFYGAPFGEHGILGFAQGLQSKDKEILLSELVRNMEGLCREEKISLMVFKDFKKEVDAILFRPLGSMGFFRIDSYPSASIKIDFKSLDEYFKKLSYSTRKNFRRKLKKIQNDNIRVEIVDDVKNILDDIYRLYLNTYNRGKIKFEKLTKDFFKVIAENLKPQAKFFLYFVDNELSAFNLCFVHHKLFIDKFIGFDYERSNIHHLYQLSWYQNVKWCLENSMEYYQMGQTDYEPKITLGGELVPLYAYVKHRHPACNFYLKVLAKLLKL